MHAYIIDMHTYIKVIFNLYAKKKPFLTPPPPHPPASPPVFIAVYCLISRVRYFAESPGLPSQVFNCPSTSKGGKYCSASRAAISLFPFKLHK